MQKEMKMEEEVITVKKSDMDYIKKVFEHLKDENEMLKLQLEPQPINEVIDLSGFTKMFINKGE